MIEMVPSNGGRSAIIPTPFGRISESCAECENPSGTYWFDFGDLRENPQSRKPHLSRFLDRSSPVGRLRECG